MQFQSQQNYGSYNTNLSSTTTATQSLQSSSSSSSTSSSQQQLATTLDSRIDQIIRNNNNLYDSIQLPKSTSNSNMPSPSSSIMFNNTNLSTTPQTSQNNNSNNYNASNASSISIPSPLNSSIYGPNISIGDALNNNIISNNNNDNNLISNLSTIKTPAHSASHSVLAAAAALQSLNQSHTQRLRIAQPQQQQSTPKPPSNSLPSQSLHANNMPKLGITSTTSSNHQNHNHLALLNQQQQQQILDNNSELTARFQLQQQQHQLQKMSPGIRPPMNWQDQGTAAAALASASIPTSNPNGPGPRWLNNAPFNSGPNIGISSISAANLTSGLINNLSNSNNMIGQDGANNSPRPKSNLNLNDQRQLMNQPFSNTSVPTSNLDLKILSGISSSIRQPTWNDNFKGPNQNIENRSKLLPQRSPLEELEERAMKFLQDLAMVYIPGTTKQKRLIITDSIDDLRSCIIRRELYTKFEEITIGILTNQCCLSDFHIYDYLRQDKFGLLELERMDNLHKRLGISDIITYITGRPPLRSSPNDFNNPALLKNNDGMIRLPQADSLTNNLNMSASIYQQQQQLSQMPGIKNTPFLPPYPGSKLVDNSSIEKNRRLSQSPSDIMSQRSQFSNGERIMMAHTSSQQNNNSINSHQTNINAHLRSTSLVNQRSLQLPLNPQSRSSPFGIQAPGSINPYSSNRPPRANSTLGIAHDPPINFNSAPLPRQPPAAHQSSTARSNLPPATNLSNPPVGPPVSAHMSSKTPQIHKSHIHSDTPVPPPSTVFKSNDCNTVSRIPEHDKFNSDPCGNTNPNYNSAKIELDSISGLPVQTLLSLKQQELMNRETGLKRGGTPLCSPMNQSGFPGLPGARSPGVLLDPHSAIKSPIGTHQVQSLYNPYPQGLNNPMLKLPQVQNYSNMPTSMPPPSFDYNKMSDPSKFGDPRLPILPSTSITNEIHLKQYPSTNTFPSPLQHSQLNKVNLIGPNNILPTGMNSNPGHNSSNQNILDTSTNYSDVVMVDIQNNQPPANPQFSPKQNVQRSIITGSASSGPKRNKKAPKNSPNSNNNNITLNIPSDVNAVSNEDPHTDIIENAIKAERQKKSPIITEINFAQNVSNMVGNSTNPPSCEARDFLSPLKSNTENEATHNSVFVTNSSPNNETNIEETTSNLSINPHNTLKDDATPINSDNNIEPNDIPKIVESSATPTETSKYQKMYTKKAWLKNYDQEDQARTSNTNDTDKDTLNQSKTEEIINNNNITINNTNSDNSDSARNSDTSLSPTATQRSTDKQVRKMPSRKVKPNSEKDEQPSTKDLQRAKELSKKRGKKDKSSDEVNSKRKLTSLQDDHVDDENIEDEEEEPSQKKNKKSKLDSLRKASTRTTEDDKSSRRQLIKKGAKKKNGDRFLQTDPCYDIVPKNIRCLECRRVRQTNPKSDKVASSKQSKTNWDDFCRFYEFRKLRYNKASQIVVAGFSDLDDADESDKILYSPNTDELPKNLSLDIAKFILKNVGNDFCNLVMQERAAIEAHDSRIDDNGKIIWKRAVNGLRELCDVCSTTLFNCHYVCERCGFVVCIDCYKSRTNDLPGDINIKSEKIVIKREHDDEESEKCSTKNNNVPCPENGQPGTPEQSTTSNSKKNKRDSFGWIYCAKNEEHSHDKLFLTQIIAGDCLEEVWKLLHQTIKDLDLGKCGICEATQLKDFKDDKGKSDSELNGLEDLKPSEIRHSNNPKASEVDSESEVSHSTLKGLLLASNSSNGVSTKPFNEDDGDSQEDKKLSQQVADVIEGCISSLPNGNFPSSLVNHSLGDSERTLVEQNEDESAVPTMTEEFDTHSWLCGGDVLVLNHANHKMNIELFRKHWKQGKPVLVRYVDKLMQVDMWLPQFFGKQFSEYKSDLVDCRNGDIHRHSMKRYWEGFEPTTNSKKKTNKEDNMTIPSANNEELSIGPCYYVGAPLWRLKDWPPGQDFNEILPNHYEDFMNNLPLKEYTTRGGELNLACRLPKEMLKPDLGPKMYSAYGTPKFPERGTTNLHLDISDAINVMVYVSGATSFQNGSEEMDENYSKTVDECVIDPKMRKQIKNKKLIPGAMWHIFKPSDVEKMREFLNKVADERNISKDKRTDPIHDQTWYLDQVLLDRLEREHGVKSFAILQCMGDAIIIPAGSPHQVKNVQNCIKVANDFVSPENVRFCLKLTNEFRSLPETHINQEDKLQIKNILYHSVKESLQYIKLSETNQA